MGEPAGHRRGEHRHGVPQLGRHAGRVVLGERQVGTVPDAQGAPARARRGRRLAQRQAEPVQGRGVQPGSVQGGVDEGDRAGAGRVGSTAAILPSAMRTWPRGPPGPSVTSHSTTGEGVAEGVIGTLSAARWSS
jgi:hypothetical protein